MPVRQGNRHPSVAPYELFDTAEGELVLAIGTDRQFAELCAVLGAPALAMDPRFAANSGRVENIEALRAELNAALAPRSAQDWAAELSDRRVPAGVVNDIEAAFRFAAAIGLDPIAQVPREDGSTVGLARNPIRLSATPVSYRSAPPRLPGTKTGRHPEGRGRVGSTARIRVSGLLGAGRRGHCLGPIGGDEGADADEPVARFSRVAKTTRRQSSHCARSWPASSPGSHAE